jgi:hypothetical protein
VDRSLVVASGIVESAESYANFAAGQYGRFLGRPPGPGDVAYWVGRLQGGMAPEAVEAEFVSYAVDLDAADAYTPPR